MLTKGAQPVSSETDESGSGRIAILLVDDRPDKLLALSTALEDLDAEVIQANSGTEALRLLLRRDFAVILLDVSMPGMDGFETASLIRQRQRSERTPIIFVTSINTTETHVSRGYSLGAVDYIFSPIESEILRAKVSVFLDLYRKTEQIRHQSELLRVQAEERATNLESRLQGLLNRLNIGVFWASHDAILIDANPAFMRLVGIAMPEQLSEFSLSNLLSTEDMRSVLQGDAPGIRDVHFTRSDGSVVWILLSLSQTRDERGRFLVQGLAEDITERKSIEQELRDLNDTLEKRVIERTEALRVSQEHLRRSERLASVGTLAAGIAHEINNPLNAILMTAQYARRSGAKIEPSRAFSIICDEAVRGGNIVKGILKFAKEETAPKSLADLNELVRHTRDLIKAYFSTEKSLTVDLQLDAGLPQVMVNATAIEQVLVNLMNNAFEASDGAARVTVRTGYEFDKVLVEVHDNGPGIPEESLPHIFDPFFSTKRSTGGTGLGLSICHGIIADHGGSIRVDSARNKGTTFLIELPVIAQDVKGEEHAKNTGD